MDPYSLDEFFVKPTDEKGHGDKVSARVPPDLARLVEVIVASRRFPYQTSSDLFRDAIWRLAGFLSTQIDSFEGTTITVKLMASEETLRFQKSHSGLLKVVDDLAVELIALDSRTEKKRVVKRIWDHFESIKEPYWKERAQRSLKEKYGEYLD